MQISASNRPNLIVSPDTATVVGIENETDHEIAAFAATEIHKPWKSGLSSYWSWNVERLASPGTARVVLYKD